jgi:hypothetical protein
MRDVDQRPIVEGTVRAGQAPWPVPSLYDDWSWALLGAMAPRAEALAAVHGQRARVARLKNPFTHLDSVATAAAKGERVLFFDDDDMALADRFSSSPKALVVPRAAAFFPCDLDEVAMARLERKAGAVMEAFRLALLEGSEGGSPPRAWVNQPGALSVRQLHVHVLPGAVLPGHRAATAADVYSEVERLLEGGLLAAAGGAP